MNEFELIEKYFAPLAQKVEGAFSLKDDAAVFTPDAGFQIVATKDAISEDVHFLFAKNLFDEGGITPAGVARKLVRVNLSDMAAMGAEPKYYLLAAILNGRVDDKWIKEFAQGLAKEQEEFGINLIGGDTVKHEGPLSFSMTLLGQIEGGKALTRAGAGADEDIYVSGTIGDGALGLKAYKGELKGIGRDAREFLIGRYNLPIPRLELGMGIKDGIASAAIDVSDGLLADLTHLCECSGVGAIIHQSKIPLSNAGQEAIKYNPEVWETALTGGDDYELLFTAPRSKGQEIEDLSARLNLSLTRIGKTTVAEEVTILDAEKNSIVFERRGYSHF